MKEIKTYRNIDNVGRITIPKIMRDNLKLQYFDEVRIHMQGSKIIITNENEKSNNNDKSKNKNKNNSTI